MSGPALVVLAAGLGTRFGGLKQFHELGPGGETFADYSLHDAWLAGFARAVFVVAEGGEEACLARYAPRWGGRVPVAAVPQRVSDLPPGRRPESGRKKPWGTAHAVWSAREAIDGPFAVVNADDFYGRPAFAAVRAALAEKPEEGVLATYPAGRTLPSSGPVARALCRVGPGGVLEGVTELRGVRRTEEGIVADGGARLEEDSPVSMNFWGLPASAPSLFEEALAELAAGPAADPDAELALPDAVATCLARKTLRVHAVAAGGAEWIGVTHREDAPAAAARLKALAAAGRYPLPVYA